jgi:ribosomal peptide maturation radical SAM protein 1
VEIMPMIDVYLVNMPYVALQRPSIALGLLAAILERDGLSTEVRYANLDFAEYEVPTEILGETAPQDCLGDWTFAGAAFPGRLSDPEPFLDGACRRYARDGQRAVRLREILHEIRREAERFIDRLAAEIAERRPRIVGCTSTFQQHVSSLALLRRLREIAPEITTMMGGANCETTMGLVTHRSFDWVDYVVSGEADGLITDLCRLALEHGGEAPADRLPLGVFGPVHRRSGYPGDGEVPRAVTDKLEGLPAPIFDSYFETLKRLPFRHEISPGLAMETSRGCWWGQKSHCTFCGLNGNGMGFRSRPPEEVLAELSVQAQRYGPYGFEVVDNILDMGYFRSLLPELAAQGNRYRLFFEVKSNLVRNQVKMLRDAGVTWIQPGIESLHTQVLKLMNKGVRASTNVQLLKWSREFGIRLSWSILYAFPQEKDEWYAETAEWLPMICHLQAPCSFNPIRIDRYSPYHYAPERFGLKLLPGRMYRHVYPVAEEDLADLVYFFNYEGEINSWERTCDEREDSPTPGIDAVGRWILPWSRLFWDDLRILCMSEEDDEVAILDTRPCASERSFRLRGLSRQVFLLCDEAPAAAQLPAELRARFGVEVGPEVLANAIAELKERKILLELDGRLISLAIRGDLPSLPGPGNFPGGFASRQRKEPSPIRPLFP